MKSVKTCGSILIILFGISVSFQWTETVISSKISFLPGLENEKGGRLSVLLDSSPVASMQRWFLCFTHKFDYRDTRII